MILTSLVKLWYVKHDSVVITPVFRAPGGR
jgi:hypothetical protein